MLLVDAVLEIQDGATIVAVKNVTCNEPCFAHLSDSAPSSAYAYPPTLVIESFCQAAGILANRAREGDSRDTVMLFGSLSGFRFISPIHPGDRMEHHVLLERMLADAAIFSGEVRVEGRVVASAERVVVALRSASVLDHAAGAHAPAVAEVR